MSTDLIHSEDYVSLSLASTLLPGNPHISTLHRWRLRGVKGIKLPTVLVGGRRYVLKCELQRFIDRLSDLADSPSSESSTTHTRRRQKAIERADRENDAAGL